MTVNEAIEIVNLLQSEDGKIDKEAVVKIMRLINGFTLSDKDVATAVIKKR